MIMQWQTRLGRASPRYTWVDTTNHGGYVRAGHGGLHNSTGDQSAGGHAPVLRTSRNAGLQAGYEGGLFPSWNKHVH